MLQNIPTHNSQRRIVFEFLRLKPEKGVRFTPVDGMNLRRDDVTKKKTKKSAMFLLFRSGRGIGFQLDFYLQHLNGIDIFVFGNGPLRGSDGKAVFRE